MNNKDNYTEVNSTTWDVWAENDIEWSRPISHEEYCSALRGEWGVYLTPVIHVPKDWFLPFKNLTILGLASGGGQQMPIFTALGAECTVFDYSKRQLELEKQVAEREGYEINIIRGDMTKVLPFTDESFDLIFHPVSNCFIEDIQHVWNECYRILKPGGVLLAGMDNGLSFLVNDDGTEPPVIVNKLPFNPLKNASDKEYKKMVDNNECIQFSHSLEEQIGGQLKAGFSLTHLYEDRDREGTGVLYKYAPQYIATRTVKK